jgi:hypothetical protein
MIRSPAPLRAGGAVKRYGEAVEGLGDLVHEKSLSDPSLSVKQVH